MRTKVVFLIAGLICSIFSCSDNKVLLEKLKSGDSKLMVCPVHILSNNESSYDTLSSKRIADYINNKKYASASLTRLCPPPNNKWRHNEARMLTTSVDLFVAYVKNLNLDDNTYILYPEFLKLGRNNNIVAVHYCLVNNKGELLIRGLLNSEWSEFQKVKPKTNEDCVAVFINGFEKHMKPY